jgi:hypothetical protein
VRPNDLKLKPKKPANLNISVENTLSSPYRSARKKTPASNRKQDKITFKASRPETAKLVRRPQLKPLKEGKPKNFTPEPMNISNQTLNYDFRDPEMI